ncbi:hypothetical protein HYDPIDRAFT_31110 [Hydnomerulius pinastri MD-312]|uniref:Uncharacterized protein n=1 Tax=Hydnomerulius pinastri MD-312 TaxID=994086 RepID=A0A0C9WCP0_9AGAM|nr:hypothetical protein HYDPIDRAFT_31110 [Hydnomerulius pinastri MD-312]
MLARAEHFLQHVQTDLSRALSLLKHKIVNFVRELANRSRAEHFTSLKTRIRGFLAEDALTLKEIIANAPLLKLGPFDFFQERLGGIDLDSPGETEADDDEHPQGIKDLGVHAPSAYRRTGNCPKTFWTCGMTFPIIHQGKFVFKRDMLISELKDRMISLFFDALREESCETSDKMMTTSSEQARSVAQDALAEREVC